MKPYDEALHIAKDTKESSEDVFNLLLKAHDQKDYRATYALATWYLHGEYVEKNVQKAIEYLEMAAQENIADAQYDLAVSYEKGNGVVQDEKKAFRLYLKASLNSDEQSIYEVGRCLYHGIGVDKNQEISDVFLEVAEQKGITE